MIAEAARAVGAEAAAIGPGIGPCCYEVGEEVRRRFADLDGVARGRMLDLTAVAMLAAERPASSSVESSGLCTSCNPELFFSHRRDGERTRAPGRIGLDYARGLCRRSRGATRFINGGTRHPSQPGDDPRQPRGIREHAGAEVEILAATKYVRADDMGALAEAGIELVGENRLQDLEAKQERWRESFTWDFIGNLQSRKVKRIVPLVRLIHSVASESVLEQLGKHGESDTEVLVEVNLSGHAVRPPRCST